MQMQKPCQDSYYTLFSSYPTLLDYHEEQAKNSRWIRCKVADLQVEPLGESSTLIGNLSAFAAGTSQEAVKDTAENLGLAMRVNGELYPVRMTAYKSLLDRAKIGGTALSKLNREVLAEVLNECLKLYSADALLLIRDEKISAVHSGDEVDYSVLPIDELLRVLQAKLDARFSGNEFEPGYCDHSLVSASWRMVIHLIERINIFEDSNIEIVFRHRNQIEEILQFISEKTADKKLLAMPIREVG